MKQVIYKTIIKDGVPVTQISIEDIPVNPDTHCSTDDNSCVFLNKLLCMPNIYWCSKYNKRVRRSPGEGFYGDKLMGCAFQQYGRIELKYPQQCLTFVYDEI